LSDELGPFSKSVEFGELRRIHELLVATTAIRARRRRNLVRRVMRPERAASYLRSAKSSCVVLGREATGLRNDEIRFCDLVTSVDTGTEYPTMNVSHSLAILLYLASRGTPRGFACHPGVPRSCLPAICTSLRSRRDFRGTGRIGWAKSPSE
jgi:hypothetical protein